MRDDDQDDEYRRRFFHHVKQWAEANLEGKLGDHPVPLIAVYPHGFSREAAERLGDVERRLTAVQEAVGHVSLACPLAERGEGDGGMMRLLVGPPGSAATRQEGIKEIRDFTREAERLVIVDPYAYGGEGAAAGEYVDELCKAARLDGKTLRELHIVYSSRHGNTNAIKKELSERAYKAQVKLTDRDSEKVHDRIWLADGKRGLVVGTSFGGLGRSRAAFLLPLLRIPTNPTGDSERTRGLSPT